MAAAVVLPSAEEAVVAALRQSFGHPLHPIQAERPEPRTIAYKIAFWGNRMPRHRLRARVCRFHVSSSLPNAAV